MHFIQSFKNPAPHRNRALVAISLLALLGYTVACSDDFDTANGGGNGSGAADNGGGNGSAGSTAGGNGTTDEPQYGPVDPANPDSKLQRGVTQGVLPEAPTADAPVGTSAGQKGTCSIKGTSFKTDDNLRIPPGEDCVFVDVYVDGNLYVAPNARLRVDNLTVDGNLEGYRAGPIAILNSDISGNLDLDEGSDILVENTFVDGNLIIDENKGVIAINHNIVDGNLEVDENTEPSIYKNRVNGNLDCEENRPAPIGGENTAADKEDQCRSL